MPQKKREIELLSPAKNYEQGVSAINFGADAVYIGAPKFSARISAGNSIEDIEKLCNYAHKFNAKVYVALNTILYENELNEAEKIIYEIYEAGADALIIQDFGILEMNLPPIPLHASTQTHNTEIEKIKFLEKVGFSRVILARELSLTEIKHINSETNIELECFVHGALCVSYSGQCYMSAFLGNRSGNRGECAQACRLKYELLDENKKIITKDKHILSLKDMNRSMSLKDMIEAGISSFKIEGRLKDINYVKNITAFYRQKIDEILENKSTYKKTSVGTFIFNFQPNPDKTFNRGFTEYYLKNPREKNNSLSPKSTGEYIGKVVSSYKNVIEIDSNFKINNADGLCFLDKNNSLKGFNVNTTKNNKIFIKENIFIENGTKLYRNADQDYYKKLSHVENCRFVKINISFSDIDKGFFLKVETTDKIFKHTKIIETEKELSKSEQNSSENIKNQLIKTGNTFFIVENCDINLSDNFFIATAKINQFRRTLLDEFENIITSSYKKQEKQIEKNNTHYYKKILDYRANISNSLAEQFFKRHQVSEFQKAFELQQDKSDKIVMTTKTCIKYNMNLCPKYQTKNQDINIKYLKLKDKIFTLEFDCQNCKMNIKTEYSQ